MKEVQPIKTLTKGVRAHIPCYCYTGRAFCLKAPLFLMTAALPFQILHCPRPAQILCPLSFSFSLLHILQLHWWSVLSSGVCPLQGPQLCKAILLNMNKCKCIDKYMTSL